MAGVFNIPAGYSFLDSLAQGLLAETHTSPLELSHTTLFLPTRKDCTELQKAFLRQSHGKSLLLPRMFPLGDLDQEEELILNTPLPDLPPVLPAFKRQGLLTKLILHYTQQHAGLVSPRSAASATQLAQALMRLIDEAQVEGVDWKKITDLVPSHLAAHWQITLDFLKIVSDHWPEILKSTGHVEPHTYNAMAVDRLIARWKDHPPQSPIIAAGSTGTRQTTARLLEAISKLEKGYVLIPGFERNVENISLTHPLSSHHQLLKKLDRDPSSIQDWPGLASSKLTGNPNRSQLFLHSMEREPKGLKDAQSPDPLNDLELIENTTSQEEALTIALLIRQALDSPGKTVALVSPSPLLFERVKAELKRWNIEGGEGTQSLKSTPQGTFILLMLGVVNTPYEAHSLLALLKHPLIKHLDPTWVTPLETHILRGPLLKPGIDPLLNAAGEDTDLHKHLSHLHEALSPLMTLIEGENLNLADLLNALLTGAQELVEDEALLWQGPEGEQFAQFFSDLLEAASDFPPIKGSDFYDLLEGMLDQYVCMIPSQIHPRLSFLKPFEARLYHTDLMILSGLNEGSWPQEPSVDSWMNRSMREDLGLSTPEQKVGLSAHDFYQVFSAPKVVLTRSLRDQGTPTVPSRWLMRLGVALKHGGLSLPRSTLYQKLTQILDQPQAFLEPQRPHPCPPLHARPRRLSVTQIETWMRDPYALYAKHILHLKPLDDIALAPSASDRGTLFHRAFEMYINQDTEGIPPYETLLSIGKRLFEPFKDHVDVNFFWWPRFEKVAKMFHMEHTSRNPLSTWTEVRGSLTFTTSQGPFTLVAQADRIDLQEGGLSTLVDYKTGQPPSVKDVEQGLSPQLPLEAAIFMEGGFACTGNDLDRVEFWWLKGGREGMAVRPLKEDPQFLAAQALEGLKHLVVHYDDPTTPYPAMPWPTKALAYNDYAHLARIQEWRAAA